MKLRHVAMIATVLVIVAGYAMISPLYLRSKGSEARQKVMLSFSMSHSAGADEWSKNLSSILDSYNLGGAVFVAGRVAEEHPESVRYFGERVDVGSQTYSVVDLTSISDYSLKLQEVKQGKMAVDSAGGMYTRLFRAPFGGTDQDIYSLLSRSNIQADLSYRNQYNVYRDGQFMKYDAIVFEARDYKPELAPPSKTTPIIINFDDTYAVSEIEAILFGITKTDFQFVSASELMGIALTSRGGEYGDHSASAD